MTPDQYRREGAQMLKKAAAMYAECAPDRIPYRDHAGGFDWREGLMDGARAAAEAIRAIDVDEVLANGWSVTCNGCGWLGDEEGLIGTLDAGDGEPCRACPTCGTDGNLMDTHPAAPDLHVTTPDAVARLVEAASDLSPWISASMSDPYNPACAEYLRVAGAFLSAIAAMETNHDRT